MQARDDGAALRELRAGDGVIAPRLATKPCECGAVLRVASDLDGNRVLLDAAPAIGGSFVTIVAWNQHVVYVGEAEPGEHVAPRERYAKHIHAAGRVAA